MKEDLPGLVHVKKIFFFCNCKLIFPLVLGLQAKEIHLCGDDSALGIIQRLCESENINVVKYKRLSPLVISPNPFHFSKLALSKGDCIICFSKKEIFKMKQRIEQLANLKCCIM